MSKQMILGVRTNKVGSDSEIGLGMTEEEWNELTEKEQGRLITDAMESLVDYWVEPEE